MQKADGYVRVVTYCPVEGKTDLRVIPHDGDQRKLLGLNAVHAEYLCRPLKGCDFCSELARRILSRTNALQLLEGLT